MVALVFLYALVMLGGAVVGGIALMFGVGAVHTWIPVVPTIGIVESLVISAALIVLRINVDVRK